ncbi:MAG TPA: hypothetical protein VJ301_12760 [Propionibacteriaceae bacterium]|nr:hypothetical protein [Propionibacteriaceae bacterium]
MRCTPRPERERTRRPGHRRLPAGSGRTRPLAARTSRPDPLGRRLRHFIYALYAEYVARHGCTGEDLEFSLSALRKITTRFSAEFAIRPFLNLFPDQVL